jgi:DNA repair exonuclease SbcCD ATPase subunit
MNTESTALTPVARASIALGAAEHEKKLIELAKQSTSIVKITNADGYQQCHSARMTLKSERIALEKLGKAARDDATKFSKAVIAEEDRLIQLIAPEEKRLAKIQEDWDAAIKAEKEAKIQAEMQRVADIRQRISFLHDEVLRVTGRPSTVIEERISRIVSEIPRQEDFQEFIDEAITVHTGIIAKMRTLLESTRSQEQEQANLKREREELLRLRAEQQARDAEAAKLQAAEDARMKAERIAEEQRIKADRDAIDEERAELAKQQAAIDAMRRPQQPTGITTGRLWAELNATKAKTRPSDHDIIRALASHFSVHESKVIEWLRDMDLTMASNHLSIAK